MKKILVFCVCLPLLFCAANVYSQGLQTELKVVRPDLSGKWMLNVSKSKWPRRDGPDRMGDKSWIMVIEQKLPAIVVTVRSQRGTSDDANFFGGRFTLYSDSRGDECIEDGRNLASKTEWKNNKLITSNFARHDDFQGIESIEEFELLTDGNTLMHTSRYTETGLNAKGEPERFWVDTLTSYQVFDRVTMTQAATPAGRTENPNKKVLLQDLQVLSRPN